jgi:adenine-specific DNA-methyltransferase
MSNKCEKCGRLYKQKGPYEKHISACTNSLSLKKDLGQYFTVSEVLQKFVFDSVKHKGMLLLEPSFGAGHLLTKFLDYDIKYPMVCYELDSTVKPVVEFSDAQTVLYADFTKQSITERFSTIVGNPPYVKQTTGNLYIKFIELCYGLLSDGGELVFIVPSDFIKLTSASSLISTMTKNGSFTDFLFPNDERLFIDASIDVLVFRYEKGLISNTTVVNGVSKVCNVSNGIITFSDSVVNGRQLSDLFHVYVGLVSGRDEVYRVPIGNVSVLNDKDKVDKYIFVESYPSGNAVIDAHLLLHKAALMERRIKKFNEKNWFEWGAPRNIKAINTNLGSQCIYIQNLSRRQNVAFVDKVQYFGGGLLCLMPKEGVGLDLMKKTVAFLNSSGFQKDYIYSGRFKIGHKQISNVQLPF